jgi:hypothetical protein
MTDAPQIGAGRAHYVVLSSSSVPSYIAAMQ